MALSNRFLMDQDAPLVDKINYLLVAWETTLHVAGDVKNLAPQSVSLTVRSLGRLVRSPRLTLTLPILSP